MFRKSKAISEAGIQREFWMGKNWIFRLGFTVAVALPAVLFRCGRLEADPPVTLLIFGGAIVASSFLLTWAAETAQRDISASFALAILALIAVLPEYAVDLFFAYSAGHMPEYTSYALANMTGSNRLLLGLGWPMVVFVGAWAARRTGRSYRTIFSTAFVLEPKRRTELAFLAIAGLYAFLIPLFHRITLLDTFFLIGLFGAYIWRISKEEPVEPELIGVAAHLANLGKPIRQGAVITIFLLAALFVLISAEPFAHALIGTGKLWHLNEFLLVQWLAPLASEAPEFIVAILFGLRCKGDLAVGTLLSSKINQWTLLVGSIPIAYLAGGGGPAIPMDARQQSEFLLTSAQTLMGFAILSNLQFSLSEALILFILFIIQFPLPQAQVREYLSALYILLAVVILFRNRKEIILFLPCSDRKPGVKR